jgi:signal transduction histidine kinase
MWLVLIYLIFICNNLFGLFYLQARRELIDFEINYSTECISFLEQVILDIDRNKIAIVLKNILSNALKFISKSIEKKIDINISIIGINTQINMDDHMASYSCMLMVEIKDTGPGISQVPTVFI